MKRYIIAILIIQLTVLVLHGQQRCDGRTPEDAILHMVEQMPVSDPPQEKIAILLTDQISAVGSLANLRNALIIRLIVNCEGQSLSFKVLRPRNSPDEKSIIELLDSTVKWLPGKLNSREVDVNVVLAFDRRDGKFVVAEAQKGDVENE